MRHGDESGQALVETLLLALVFLVPLLSLLASLSHVHRGALAAAAAAREAGFEAARSMTRASADEAVDLAVRQAFANHGLSSENVDAAWTTTRLERGGSVEVRISYPVPVLRVPFLGAVSGPAVSVRARHRARVDPFRSRR